MIQVSEMVGPTGRRVLSEHETYEQAVAAVRELGVSFMERDPDYENCADALLRDGRVICVQPADLVVESA